MEVLWPCLYFPLAVAGHALLVRLPLRGTSVSKFLLAGGLAGLGLAVHLLLTSEVSVTTFAALAAFAFASELYTFLFTMIASSVSTRLPLTLRQGNRTTAEIENLYDSTNMVQRRVECLLGVGLLVWDGLACRISPRGTRLVKAFTTLERFFRHPPRAISPVPWQGERIAASGSARVAIPPG